MFDWLLGKEGGPVSTLTPQQQQSQSLLLQNLPQLLQMLGRGVQPSQGFQNIANQQETNFQTRTIPSLAERFTAMGSPLSSGGYREALGRAASGLHENLAGMGYQAGLQERGQNMDLFRLLMSGGMSPAIAHQNAQPGILQQLIPAAATVGASYFGGPVAGAAVGSLMGGSGGGNQQQGFQQFGTQQSNPWQEQLSNMKNMNSRDFFSNSGIMRG